MPRPASATAAGVLFIQGGLVSLATSAVLAHITAHLWAPAYAYGVPAGLYAILTGARLLTGRLKGRGVPKLPAFLLLGQVINADGISLVLGAVILFLLSNAEARAYFLPISLLGKGEEERRQDSEEGVALEVHLDFLGLAVLLNFCVPVLLVDGQVVARGWGGRTAILAPGTHRVEVWYPYFNQARSGYARLEVEASPGEPVSLLYAKNDPWVFSPGRLFLRPRAS